MSNKIKFFTPVQIPIQEDKIWCNSRIITLGSCFSENIGNLLSNHLFNTLVNPFGTIFNPISITKGLDLALNKKSVDIHDLDSIGSRFFHYDFHSSFDNTYPHEVEKKINDAIINTYSCLQKTDFLVLTFGSSIVYRLNKDDSIVSNCHKVPSKHFRKTFLTADFMEDQVINSLNLLKAINPEIKVILTVSPVRHTKEGVIENSLSKSRLIDLCHRLIQREEYISYFPAYEIMIDELRDYRYYGIDMVHPNEQAINIIWNRFMNSYFDDHAIQKVNDISDLNSAKNHIPFDSKSEEHLRFKHNQQKKMRQLKVKYPEVDFTEFEQFFNT